jgi:hypothetical protein
MTIHLAVRCDFLDDDLRLAVWFAIPPDFEPSRRGDLVPQIVSHQSQYSTCLYEETESPKVAKLPKARILSGRR